jgi:UDPglucose 6-dehydrogenase
VRVVVVGAGYVGLVTGACLSSSGHTVTVVENDAAKLAVLCSGGCPIYEPGLTDIIVESVSAGMLAFSGPGTGLGEAEVVVIAVGTPPTESGAADLSQVRAAVHGVCEAATAGATVVMKSTVPVGTSTLLAPEITAARLGYASNPEFLREGSAVNDWFHTDRIVVGASDDHTRETVHALYAGVDAPFVDCDITSAEMIKYASNAFLATKISFMNEIANVCDRVGADVMEVARGLGLDRRIGPAFLNAGIGYGGSCFPKDTRALDSIAATSGYRFRLLRAVIEVNTEQRQRAIVAVRGHVGDLRGRAIALLGLTFKPNTDDTRESPAIDIAESLLGAGARVRAHDPVGVLPAGSGAEQFSDVYETLEGCDACIVAVEWPEYAEIDWHVASARMRPGVLVFDGRNCLDPVSVRAAGLDYQGVGRSGPGRAEAKRDLG